MLAVMAARGVLERREGGRYRLGLRMFEYGQLALSRLNLFEVSVPILAVLRDRVREMVQLGIPIGAEILFLERFEAQSVDTALSRARRGAACPGTHRARDARSPRSTRRSPGRSSTPA